MISLLQAKEQLRVLSNDKDDMIADLIDRAAAILQRHCGDLYDPYSDVLDAAQMLLVEWLYDPEGKFELDEVYNLPRAVIALARHHRIPGLG